MTDMEILITYIALGIIALGLLSSIAYLIAHQQQYSFKEMMRRPWLIFSLMRDAKNLFDDKLDEIKQEAQQTIEVIEEVKEIVKDGTESITSLSDAFEKAKEEIDEIIDKVDGENN